MKSRRPTAPGISFYNLYIKPERKSLLRTSKEMGIDYNDLIAITRGQDIDESIAAKMGKITDTSTESWYNMQLAVDKFRAASE